MITVQHRFATHSIHPETQTLIIGTFNPETKANSAEFFYGRSRNHLWKILPTAFGEPSLKGSSTLEKILFIRRHKLDFTDLISDVHVEEGQEANYDDRYLDGKISRWQDIPSQIEELPELKKVCFTRRTFSGIPNMKRKIEEIKLHCEKNNIYFKELTTPARIYTESKQLEWNDFLLKPV
ncbi:uracil-DNA glycosylase family protein [Algoriphagus litoralis]|uniref:hypothetical protein n=1 Tax=Algoriphagus litoralis TaxID=2202829 RepID=UPI000DBABE2A|nr:hypothetical protein [Algoriphagus litoralis]